MIFTIFKKELKETLRDRRTLMMMLIIPILIFPVIMNVFISISSSFEKKAAEKEITIGALSKNSFFITALNKIPEALGKKKFHFYKDSISLMQALESDQIMFAVFDAKNMEAQLLKNQNATVNWYFKATDLGIEDRAKKYMDQIIMEEKVKRYDRLHIDFQLLEPIEANYHNVSSSQEMIGKIAGGILPYLFIAFGFLGCMYPSIDLFTGEKERGTLETLLTVPVSRFQLLLGKMLVVITSGLFASTAALLGLFISIEFLPNIGNTAVIDVIHEILSLKFILLLYTLLIPLVVFFAGILIPISLYVKSFKEAQSIIAPLNIVVILPAMVGFFPGIELNFMTACIPIVNVVLATKELIAGHLEISLLALSFLVMVLIAMTSFLFSFKQFEKESNIIL